MVVSFKNIFFLSFKKTIKTPVIACTFTIMLFLLLSIIYLFGAQLLPGVSSQSIFAYLDWYYTIGITIYTSLMLSFCHLTFNKNDLIFYLMRPISRKKYYLSKILVQFVYILFFALFTLLCWVIADKMNYPNEYFFGLFTGEKKTVVSSWPFRLSNAFFPFLLSGISCISIICVMRLLNANTIPIIIYPIIVLALFFGYFVFTWLYKIQNNPSSDINDLADLCWWATLSFPLIFYSSVSGIGFIASLSLVNRMDIKS